MLHNTGSIHMYCIATAIAPGQRRIKVLGAASLSIFLTASQLVLMRFVQTESSYPSCALHENCPTGNFCDAWDPRWQAPRCADCYRVFEDVAGLGLNATACAAVDQSFAHLAEPSRWHDGVFDYTFADGCLAWNHCVESDNWADECDHLKVKMDRLHWTTKLVLILVSFLMALPLAQDMDEAVVEEALLNHQLNGGGRSPPVLVAAALLHASLHIRLYVLPIVTSTTAVAVLVASSFSSADILLNLLAVSFVTEADNMVATVFLPPKADERADALIKSITSPIVLPWLEVRVRACVCITVIAYSSLNMQMLVEYTPTAESDDIGRRTCNNISTVLAIVQYLVAGSFVYILQPVLSVLRNAFRPSEQKVRGCGEQAWLCISGTVSTCAVGAWAESFGVPGRPLYLQMARICSIAAISCIIIDVVIRTICNSNSTRKPARAHTNADASNPGMPLPTAVAVYLESASSTLATAESTKAVAQTPGVDGVSESASSKDITARLLEEMKLMKAADLERDEKMATLEAENRHARELMAALVEEVASLKQPAREGDEVAAIKVRIVKVS